ncbi:Lsm (Like Sm) protein, putative [Yarrowia lipolytica]|nr:Lsm (Like Sm) protein, putative [Yarrowia lipolytica]
MDRHDNRGGRRGGRGGHGNAGHYGGHNQHQNQQHQQNQQQQNNQNQGQSKKLEFPKREPILDLSRFENKRVVVKVTGRKIEGTLKGWDQLMNLILDDVKETVYEDEESEDFAEFEGQKEGKVREIGLAVIRGPNLLSIYPLDGGEGVEVEPKPEVTI